VIIFNVRNIFSKNISYSITDNSEQKYFTYLLNEIVSTVKVKVKQTNCKPGQALRVSGG
jgi:hypothetical protein